MTMILRPICMDCKNYDWDKNICPAFPKGISEKILSEGDPHSKPIEGQKGNYVFEPIKNER